MAAKDGVPQIKQIQAYIWIVDRELEQFSIKPAAAVKLEPKKRTKAKSLQERDQECKKFSKSLLKNVCEAMKELDLTIPREFLDTAPFLTLGFLFNHWWKH